MPDIRLVDGSTTTSLLLLVIAFVLSAVIGLERQRRLKSVGLRTHTLVGMGAALFTLVSGHGFADVLRPDVVLDPSRIAAQIVSGIGFLGAGVIFVRRNGVSGLTTAASIWVTAAIGMACGAGLPTLAAATTVLYLVAVVGLTAVGRLIERNDRERTYEVHYADGSGVLRQVLARATELGYEASLLRADSIEGATPGVAAVLRLRRTRRGPFDDFATILLEIDGVVSVRDDDGDEHD